MVIASDSQLYSNGAGFTEFTVDVVQGEIVAQSIIFDDGEDVYGADDDGRGRPGLSTDQRFLQAVSYGGV